MITITLPLEGSDMHKYKVDLLLEHGNDLARSSSWCNQWVMLVTAWIERGFTGLKPTGVIKSQLLFTMLTYNQNTTRLAIVISMNRLGICSRYVSMHQAKHPATTRLQKIQLEHISSLHVPKLHQNQSSAQRRHPTYQNHYQIQMHSLLNSAEASVHLLAVPWNQCITHPAFCKLV